MASIIEGHDSFVEGILWTVLPDDENTLDRYEGVSANINKKTKVVVRNSEFDNNEPALVYIATESNYGNARMGYLEKIVGAAKRFEFETGYIEEVNTRFNGEHNS
ncbi:gamma-glutamylcyclotransferase family protein [Bacillus tuaregi]|uniref:gamma-glutamylcyclotransferase family protein n=1 Tax=Bacillus tuaregi TaxID=1816695 RepID=UPI0008F892ED|nr:gamma-glutamylcyclotransferase family protein [Bacillus tuaregi]